VLKHMKARARKTIPVAGSCRSLDWSPFTCAPELAQEDVRHLRQKLGARHQPCGVVLDRHRFHWSLDELLGTLLLIDPIPRKVSQRFLITDAYVYTGANDRDVCKSFDLISRNPRFVAFQLLYQ